MKALALLSMVLVTLPTPFAVIQDAGSGVAVLKCSWDKERTTERPSFVSMASQDELVQASRRERQLASARSTANRGAETTLETQITNHESAKAKATQSAPPGFGYRYKVTLRNDSTKTIKSIDWDYLFIDPLNNNTIVARHQFTSDETIKPGKHKEVSVLYQIAPVKTVNINALKKKGEGAYSEQVVIARVQFSDGSVWQLPN